MRPLCLFLVTLPFCPTPANAHSQAQRQWTEIDKPATEAELRAAVDDINQLAHALQSGLKRYREHLLAALSQQGYGPYHPLFRTSLNGFEQDQIDLEDLDQFKMGAFAYMLQDMGTRLDPDPFSDWMEVQKNLAVFEIRMSNARRVVARTNIYVAHSDQNIQPDLLRKLRKHWLATAEQARNAYEHAMAVRAVKFEDGEIVPAPANVRRIFGGGRYAVICAFNVCTSQPAIHEGEHNRVPRVH